MAYVYWIHHKDVSKHFDMTAHGYVGITSRPVQERFRQHQCAAKQKLYPIHFAFLKYGEDLVVDTLVEGSLEYCQHLENQLRPERNIGYNCAVGGASTGLGNTYSDETKERLSEIAKNRKFSEETRKRMSEAQKRRPPASEATRKKLSESNKGKEMSQQARDKISRANKGRKCKPFSEEHRQRLAEAGKGKVMSAEACEKIRVKATGRVKTQEAKDKFSLAMTGRNLWENSAARKDLWAIADKFAEMVILHPKTSARKIALMLGEDNCNPWKLVDKIRAGWSPSADNEYLKWLEEYKINKECYGT